ncbi:uncharacterized protein LOC121734806 [Aricia agestis]|uniref:uncharacterized protein LOC121734806 n=1 Tax=Aricia agestis TaxID=91739 RepID=UPI001C202C9F|nr:uncharacterized protein LOC121734806 [Aricia agestis]
MKCPVVTKCCFCVPLRKGVLIFGYINLIISLLCLPILIFMTVEGITTHDIFEKVHEEGAKVHLNLTIAFTALDVLMTSILLFGVHKKKKNILKVYFYTGLVLQTLPFFIDVIFFEANTALENFAYFFAMGLNYYLLFLVYQLIYTAEEPAAGMQFTNHTPNTNLYV